MLTIAPPTTKEIKPLSGNLNMAMGRTTELEPVSRISMSQSWFILVSDLIGTHALVIHNISFTSQFPTTLILDNSNAQIQI